jgi:hypothetical protein
VGVHVTCARTISICGAQLGAVCILVFIHHRDRRAPRMHSPKLTAIAPGTLLAL